VRFWWEVEWESLDWWFGFVMHRGYSIVNSSFEIEDWMMGVGRRKRLRIRILGNSRFGTFLM